MLATGGTAIRERHIKALVTLGIETLVLALDDDAAGKTATERFIALVLQHAPGIRVQVVPSAAYMGEKDPAAVIERFGVAAFTAAVDARLPWAVHAATKMLGDLRPTSPVARRRDTLFELSQIARRCVGPERMADLEDIAGLAVPALGYPEAAVREALGLTRTDGSFEGTLRASDSRPGTLSKATLALLQEVCEGPLPEGAYPGSDEAVWAVVEELGERQCAVLAYRFGRDGPSLSLEQTARLVTARDRPPITRERVRQLQLRAIRRLRLRGRYARLLGLQAAPPRSGVTASKSRRNADWPIVLLGDEIVRMTHLVGGPVRVTVLVELLRAEGSPRESSEVVASLMTGASLEEARATVKRACVADPRLTIVQGDIVGLDPESRTLRTGAPWTDAEETSLGSAWCSGEPLRTIAERHRRTSGAIAARLVRLGYVPDRDAARRLSSDDGAGRLAMLTGQGHLRSA